eukprot:CAMPEP_0202818456 /NCGR_PEP_ID=MMETSP1389-20130828/8357_1 /ASSEMBLY_ACC=CAM_ASM_000865 /TAXON_ID=302021 /ORGANISM="Rhodomonas sp., Strain CCMP768" /LENGTH=85 /DNA_ID=CAMNT_0049490823 /DNA_START=254 /DNA_END=511 /DNA_ORIENTATION=+
MGFGWGLKEIWCGVISAISSIFHGVISAISSIFQSLAAACSAVYLQSTLENMVRLAGLCLAFVLVPAASAYLQEFLERAPKIAGQ